MITRSRQAYNELHSRAATAHHDDMLIHEVDILVPSQIVKHDSFVQVQPRDTRNLWGGERSIGGDEYIRLDLDYFLGDCILCGDEVRLRFLSPIRSLPFGVKPDRVPQFYMSTI
jgi:hypothetical protein